MNISDNEYIRYWIYQFGIYLITNIKSNQILFIYAETLLEIVFISAPQLLNNKRKENYRYGIDGVGWMV